MAKRSDYTDDGEFKFDSDSFGNQSQKRKRKKRLLGCNSTIAVAIISAIGTIIAALIAFFPLNGEPPLLPNIFCNFDRVDVENSNFCNIFYDVSIDSVPTPDVVGTEQALTATAIALTPTMFPPTPTTQPTIILRTPMRSNGITQCELQELLDSAITVSELQRLLDIYWDNDPNKGGDWAADDVARGLILEGALVFWTNLFESNSNLPNGVQPLLTQGGWGVFFVQSGTQYQMGSGSPGGRYLRVIASNDCGTPIPPPPQTPITFSCNSTDLPSAWDSRISYIRFYSDTYINCGWETVWNSLVAQGVVAGELPLQRTDRCWGQWEHDYDEHTCEGDYGVSTFMLNATSPVEIDYPHCFAYGLNSRLTTVVPQDDVMYADGEGSGLTANATITGSFTLFLWCIAEWR